MKAPRNWNDWFRGVIPSFIAAVLIGGGVLILLSIMER